MTTAGWKDYKCERCDGEFTRRAVELPKLCFTCQWQTSDAKKQRDLKAAIDLRVAHEAALYEMQR